MLSLVHVIVGPLTAFGGAPPKGEHDLRCLRGLWRRAVFIFRHVRAT